jgi:histidyl-tRNA synthetase
MHKRRQPVKLWYLSSFFRHERAQAGRYRQFWQVGAEALGSDDPAVDAESITLLAALLAEMEVRDVTLRLSSLGGADSRSEYRERLQAHLRANERSLSDDVRSRIDVNPLRAFDSDHPGTARVMESAPRLLEYLSSEDAEHFAQVRALLDAANVSYEVDSTLVRGRWRRALRRPRRAAGRPTDARHGLGGRNRADPAGGRYLGARTARHGPAPGAVRGPRGAGRGERQARLRVAAASALSRPDRADGPRRALA